MKRVSLYWLRRGLLYQISLYIVVLCAGISLCRGSFNRKLVLEEFLVPRIDLLRHIASWVSFY